MIDISPDEIPCDVQNLIASTAAALGRVAEKDFSMSLAVSDGMAKIESPIEAMFYVTFRACMVHPYLAWPSLAITIDPQKEIDTYRVDFAIQAVRLYNGELAGPRVVVECDGHAFHDKDEKQRRYEKKRDRAIQAAGYRVCRYTGSELTANPFDAAREVLDIITSTPAVVASA